jgi:dual specificity tyrosine-phosphorylation-regulated kinase 2/3/4
LAHRFEVLKILGKGSFAQVVEAFDHKNKCTVAIKINRNSEIDHEFAQNEANLLDLLMQSDPLDTHNIVRLLEHSTWHNHKLFVFELLSKDLFTHLQNTNYAGLKATRVKEFTKQIVDALVFLETKDIIHCDLKPENVLINEQGDKVKLCDFGSGCFTKDQVYTYVQSRFYRAPEVVLRIAYSPKVDVWSLGCIVFELFTGQPLFPGQNE